MKISDIKPELFAMAKEVEESVRWVFDEIDETAHRRAEQIMAELLAAYPAPDKATQQMAWVQHMNSLKAQAEEIILDELIYN